MNSLYTLVVAIQVLMALVIIGLVLVQHGKGADMGAAFGSGASGSLFGATGSSSFLSKATGVAATLFFCATLGLAYLSNTHTAPSSGVMNNLTVPPTPKSTTTKSDAIPSTSATDANQPTVQSAAETKAAARRVAPATTKQADQIPK